MIAKTGLLPTEISALGIKFDVADQKALLSVLAAVVVYFTVACSLYAVSDFLAWRLSLWRAFGEWAIRRAKQTDKEKKAESEALLDAGEAFNVRSVPRLLITPVSTLRTSFEFLVPLAFASYVVTVVLTASPTQKPPNPSLETT